MDQFLERAREGRERDQELVVDPQFFVALKTHLPRISAVKIQPKISRH